ncbi:MAG: 50S ribosomal protein L23 [Candidatus Paceibacterota bacterium]
MALFRIKKDTEKEKATPDAVVSNVKETKQEAVVKSAKGDMKTPASELLSLNYKKDIPSVLAHPRVTEKATIMSEQGVYVFDVAPRSTKKDVAEAVQALYKVTPRKINMVKVPAKRVRMRKHQNRYGVKSGGKKAYVYVKKGDVIDIV